MTMMSALIKQEVVQVQAYQHFHISIYEND